MVGRSIYIAGHSCSNVGLWNYGRVLLVTWPRYRTLARSIQLAPRLETKQNHIASLPVGEKFDSHSIETPTSKDVGFELLVKALDATDEPPKLLVMNACNTLDGAAVVLPTVPVIIGMSDAVADVAAIIFAQQFYAAIASGQSVGNALKQAKVSIEAALVDPGESDLPQHIARDGVDIGTLVMVTPPENHP